MNVRGATMLESEGMAKAILKRRLALLEGPFEKMPGRIANSKTIFTVIPDETTTKKLS